MRKELKKYLGKRMQFTANFERFGKTSMREGLRDTVLLREIAAGEGSRPVTDHVWTLCVDGFRIPDLSRGDRLRFRARVSVYLKRDRTKPGGKENLPYLDYHFSRITEVRKIA